MDRDPYLPSTYDYPSAGQARRGPSPSYPAWPQQNGGQAAEPEIDWRRWGWLLWRRKWWIIAGTLLGTALAIVSARGHEPVYQARAMVWVEAPESNGPIEITDVFSTSGWIDLLRSYAVLDATVHDLKLYLSPAQGGDWDLFENFELTDNTASGLYQLVVRLDNTYALLDAEGRQIQVAGPAEVLGEPAGFRWLPPDSLLLPGRDVQFSLRRPRDVADGLARKLEVSLADDESNFIGLAYQGTNPVKIANVLNSILDRFVGLATELKREKLVGLGGTLEEQLGLASERLRLAESRLQTYRVNTITLPDDRRDRVVIGTPGQTNGQGLAVGDPVFDRYFTLQVDREMLSQDLQNLADVLGGLEETGNLDAMKLEAIPSVQTASSLVAALEELGRMELEHRTLLYRYTPEHLDVQKIEGDLNVLQHQTIPALVRQLMARLSARRSQLDNEIGSQTTALQRIPPRAIEESRLRRDVALAEQLYNSLQLRYKETQVAEAATQPSVRILDRASPPANPSQNTARMIVLVGFALSLGLSLAGAIAHVRFVDRRIQYPEQVVDDLDLPILGVVPNLKALTAKASDDGRVETTPEVQSVVESFRALRTQLTLGLGIQYPAVIAITSPSKGDGKSMITANLALAFADRDRPTILVDADVRRGGLHRTFGFNSSPGLADYLRGDADTVVIAKNTDTDGLYFIPRGGYSDDVPELLDGEGLPALLNHLKQRFSVVMIDTPPLSAGIDAVMIGAHADAVLAVLRKGRTDLDLARAKIDSFARMLGIPIVGAILNDVDREGPYRYYTYSYDVQYDEATK
jgi:capsular exopolysaccharide synthesis family protein